MLPSRFSAIRQKTTLAYMAGLLEGEGSFLAAPPSSPNQAGVALAMTDHDVVDRLATLVESKVIHLGRRREHHKEVFACRVRGGRAIEIMEALHPLLGKRRQGQIERATASRSVSAPRRMFAAEVAELLAAKRSDAYDRSGLAARFGVTPKTINKLTSTYGRDVTGDVELSRTIEAIEDAISQGSGGSTDLCWLAGLLEGEGIFCSGVRAIKLKMGDRDVVERAAGLLGGAVKPESPDNPSWSMMWTTSVGGRNAVDVAASLTPLFGARRSMQAKSVIDMPYKDRSQPGAQRAVSPDRIARNLDIARRVAGGESGPAVAADLGMTHQNVYYIARKYRAAIECPSG